MYSVVTRYMNWIGALAQSVARSLRAEICLVADKKVRAVTKSAFSSLLFIMISATSLTGFASAPDKADFIKVSEQPVRFKQIETDKICFDPKPDNSDLNETVCITGFPDENGLNEKERSVGTVTEWLIGNSRTEVLCIRDEHGVHCPKTKTNYGEDIAAFLAEGSLTQAQINDGRVCQTKPDQSIECLVPSETTYDEDGNPQIVPQPRLSFGQIEGLRGYTFGYSELCYFTDSKVTCKGARGKPILSYPTPVLDEPLTGIRSIKAEFGSLCALSDEGLTCIFGSYDAEALNSTQPSSKIRLEAEYQKALWMGGSLEQLCFLMADRSIRCLRYRYSQGDFIDITPTWMKTLGPVQKAIQFDTNLCLILESGELECSFNLVRMEAPHGLGKVRSVAVQAEKVCAVDEKSLRPFCFTRDGNDFTPLTSDKVEQVHRSGPCGWTTQRFHCAETPVNTRFDDVLKVYDAAELGSVAACFTMKTESNGARARCYGRVPRDLARQVPTEDLGDRLKIKGNMNFVCTYSQTEVECFGSIDKTARFPSFRDIWKIALNPDGLCIVDALGSICISSSQDPQFVREMAIPPSFQSEGALADIARGTGFACGATPQLSLECWGINRAVIDSVPFSSDVISVDAYGQVACMNTTHGGYCWGGISSRLTDRYGVSVDKPSQSETR